MRYVADVAYEADFQLAITCCDGHASHSLVARKGAGQQRTWRRIAMKVTHLVDPIENDRSVPGVGQKVRVTGCEGLFLVLHVDQRAGKADLLGCGPGPQLVRTGVPLSLLHVGYDYLPELFRWYVEAAPAN
jgi:hypothetical protein